MGTDDARDDSIAAIELVTRTATSAMVRLRGMSPRARAHGNGALLVDGHHLILRDAGKTM